MWTKKKGFSQSFTYGSLNNFHCSQQLLIYFLYFWLTLSSRALSNAACLPLSNVFVMTTQRKSVVNWGEEYRNRSFESRDERLNLSQLEKVTNYEERKPKSTLQERLLFLVLRGEHLQLIGKIVMETQWLQQRPFRPRSSCP